MFIFDELLLLFTWERLLNSQNNSKFIKEQEVLTIWTIDGVQYQRNLNWRIAHGHIESKIPTKILGAVLELSAKQHCQSYPFT